jgi:diaminohydroxyphosphoribosylaminopyrimidine deaminase / 5-amino-6-(5-phosphoribosylamino)uracil reductase
MIAEPRESPPAAPLRPHVTLHFAQTLDGRIATRTGSSRWISGPPATRFAHELRAEADAVIIGSGTAIADDPLLTVRLVEGRQPIRIVLDARARLAPTSKLLADASTTTIHATCSPDRGATAPHVEAWCLPPDPGGVGVDLDALLARLGARGVARVLVEGGSCVITAFLRLGLADRIIVTVAPMILGKGIDAVGDLGIDRLDRALRFTPVRVFSLGDDVLIELAPRRASEPST